MNKPTHIIWIIVTLLSISSFGQTRSDRVMVVKEISKDQIAPSYIDEYLEIKNDAITFKRGNYILNRFSGYVWTMVGGGEASEINTKDYRYGIYQIIIINKGKKNDTLYFKKSKTPTI